MKKQSGASGSKPTSSILPYQTPRLRDHYLLGRKLGQGQFGTTYLCTEKASGEEYACKSIAKRKLLCKDDYEDVWREIQIMHHLSEHPHVVRIKGTYEDNVFVHLVMELCGGGELFDRIVQKGHYSEKKAAQLMKIIVGVVEGCHSLGVMHRDLKPENFLFDSRDEDAKLKAIDFGLSVFYKPGQYLSDVVGSPYYVAPEVLHKYYGPEIDVWSAGVILYILLCGVPPFWAETDSGIFRQILKGKLDFESDPWPHISESAKDLIRKMLDRSPRQRITAHEVLCHPWIVDDRVAPDKPLDSAVLTRLKQFSAMNKLKKVHLCRSSGRLATMQIAAPIFSPPPLGNSQISLKRNAPNFLSSPASSRPFLQSKFSSIPSRKLLCKPPSGKYVREDYLVKKFSAQEIQELVKGDRNVPLIIDFYATWCGPCILMAQELEMLAVEYESNAMIVKVDTDDEYEFARDMQVRGLPTVYFVSPDPNKDAIRTEGLIPIQMMRDIIDNDM